MRYTRVAIPASFLFTVFLLTGCFGLSGALGEYTGQKIIEQATKEQNANAVAVSFAETVSAEQIRESFRRGMQEYYGMTFAAHGDTLVADSARTASTTSSMIADIKAGRQPTGGSPEIILFATTAEKGGETYLVVGGFGYNSNTLEWELMRRESSEDKADFSVLPPMMRKLYNPDQIEITDLSDFGLTQPSIARKEAISQAE